MILSRSRPRAASIAFARQQRKQCAIAAANIEDARAMRLDQLRDHRVVAARRALGIGGDGMNKFELRHQRASAIAAKARALRRRHR